MNIIYFFRRVISGLGNRGFFKWLSDDKYLKLIFPAFTGYKLDLDSPRTFNEKLQWLKLYNRKDIHTCWVDKYAVRSYASKVMGEEKVIPLVGGPWNSFDEIDFEKLPDEFVLKCNHDSQSVFICRNKKQINYKKLRSFFNNRLKNNYYYGGREWPYKNVAPKLIAEKYMVDDSGVELKDYKFFCFNGEPLFFKIDFNRLVEHHANYYDMNGNLIDLYEKEYPPVKNKKITIPNSFDKMKSYAKIFSKGEPFLRVDFYEINGSPYFGELTLYPSSGFGKITPSEWDVKLGELVDIASIK